MMLQESTCPLPVFTLQGRMRILFSLQDGALRGHWRRGAGLESNHALQAAHIGGLSTLRLRNRALSQHCFCVFLLTEEVLMDLMLSWFPLSSAQQGSACSLVAAGMLPGHQTAAKHNPPHSHGATTHSRSPGRAVQ